MKVVLRVACAIHGLLPLLAVGFSVDATGQTYPVKPVRMISPFAPGGGADLVARMVAEKMTDYMGQTVLVDNRAGANGNIGMEIAARAQPDGYTVVMGTSAMSINAALDKKLSFDAVKDFSPVSLVNLIAFVMVAHPSVPASNVQQLIAYAKTAKQPLSYGSAGLGNSTHLDMALFESVAKIKLSHVPYKGTGQALTELLGGHIQMLFGTIPATLQLVQAGKLKALGVGSQKRAKSMPTVATIAEQGFPGFMAGSWYGVLAPARTPPGVVDSLNRSIVKAVNLPDVNARLLEQGSEPIGNTPEQFAAFIRSELVRYEKVVRESGVKID
jgi:tripartite-type tricarboxylate transporter receptor subunit TctC